MTGRTISGWETRILFRPSSLTRGLMETASDDALADFNADGIADLAVGRLAVERPDRSDRRLCERSSAMKTVVRLNRCCW